MPHIRLARRLALVLFITVGLTAADRPNVIFMLADDMGYADVGAFGGVDSLTPNLDRLAAEGTRMTQFYSASAVCTPTRASILTGRYPLRWGITKHFPDDEQHLPPQSITIAELLRDAGYRTAHVGKWHLGGLHQKHLDDRANSIPGPHEHGFDHYLTQLEDPPIRAVINRENRLYKDGGKHLVRDDRNLPPDARHYTDVNGDEAVAYIEQLHATGDPFFLNVWWMVPHKPYEQAPEPFWRMYEGWAEGDQRKFRSMVSHMDHKIGEILSKLDELGIADDTLIVFTSDNGGAYEADIGPWKGGKTDLHEGGVRVPFIARWPGRIPAGVASDQLGHSNDMLPTLAAAAGVEFKHEIDGRSLLPHLTTGAPILDRGMVFWQIGFYARLQRHYPKPEPYATEAVRDGRWKLFARDGEPVELIDLEADPRERENLVRDEQEVVARMTAALRNWLSEPRLSPLP